MTNTEKIEYLERIHEKSKNTIIQIMESKEFPNREMATVELARAYQKKDKVINLILKLDGRRKRLYSSAEWNDYCLSASFVIIDVILDGSTIDTTEDDD